MEVGVQYDGTTQQGIQLSPFAVRPIWRQRVEERDDNHINYLDSWWDWDNGVYVSYIHRRRQ